ncbi:MAG: alpha/beta hydrolase [Nevskiales bacterium]|nr:alpha/beta hydrolase [Nevskiales bacterium]
MMDPVLRPALRMFIRHGVRPWLGGRLPYAVQRGVATAVTSVCLAPRGMRHEAVQLGGVPCERVTVGEPKGRRTLLWIHGGGYCVGSSRTDRAPAGQFAKAAEATVIVPDYRLAPENPYPAGLDDVLAVYRALLDNGQDPDELAVGGDSAGGGMTVALAVAIRDAGLPLPRALVLCSPWADLRGVQPSYRSRAKRDPWLSPRMLRTWAEAYCASTPLDHPACSPLLADLAGLPPTLIQVGECEILHDDAVELDRKLRFQGGTSELHVYPDMWHVFFLQAGLLDPADAAVREIGDFLRRQWTAHRRPRQRAA